MAIPFELRVPLYSVPFALLACAVAQDRDRRSTVDASSAADAEPRVVECTLQTCDSAWAACLLDAERLARACFSACDDECNDVCALEARRAVSLCKMAFAECHANHGASLEK